MKRISLIFAILLLFSSFATAAEDNNEYKTGYDDGYDEGYYDGQRSVKSTTPIVKIVESLDTPEVKAGDVLEIKPVFRNDSGYMARNLSITPIFEDNAVLVYERPLTFSTTTALGSKKDISATFRIRTAENAKEGTYPLKFKVEFKNGQGDLFTREEVTYFKIIEQKTKPVINVSGIMINPNSYKYGDIISLGFDVSNSGGSEAKDVEINLEGFSADTIMPIASRDSAFLETLPAGNNGSKNTSRQVFDLKISNNIAVTDTVIKATITYKDYENKENTITKNFYITGITPKPEVSGEKKEEKKEEDKSPKPKMIVSSYGLSPNNITAGQEFTFSFYLKNTSKEKAIRNIKITVSSFEGCFIITKGSNTFYVEGMNANEQIYKQIDLKPKQDLQSNSYAVYIDAEYEDYDGTEYTAKETIHVPVTEYSKLVINNINCEDAYVGTSTNLSFEYVNMGKATLSNLVATVNGDVIPAQESSYIGNIQAGNSDYYDIEVTPSQEGTNNGTLILTFEDSSGKKISVSKDFTITAHLEETINPGYDDYNYTPVEDETEETKFEVWQIILAGIGAFLVLFVVARFITKKIILKKFEDEL